MGTFVSSVRYTALNKLSNEPWITGCADWMWSWGLQGWKPYYVNFMFKPFAGNGDAVAQQMRTAIENGFYPVFCKRFASHPTKPSQQKKLPKLWLPHDRPVYKRSNKTSIREMQFNDEGGHYNGGMLLPPVSRFHENVVQHLEENRRIYAVEGIDRIHVTPATWDLDGLANYAGKTLNWDRSAEERILLLPDDRVKRPVVVLTSEERAIKDFQARHNVSEDIARRAVVPAFNAQKKDRR